MSSKHMIDRWILWSITPGRVHQVCMGRCALETISTSTTAECKIAEFRELQIPTAECTMKHFLFKYSWVFFVVLQKRCKSIRTMPYQCQTMLLNHGVYLVFQRTYIQVMNVYIYTYIHFKSILHELTFVASQVV